MGEAMITIPYVPYILRFFGSATAAPVAVYSTIALGLAGTTSGQWFAVIQSTGDGLDYYTNTSGVATFRFSRPFGIGEQAAAIQLLERSPVVTVFPVTPYSLVESVNGFFTNGRETPDAINPGASKNIYCFSSGDIRFTSNSGVTVTRFYADGPTSTGTAARCQFTTTAAQAKFHETTVRPPAGTYTLKFKLRSTAGAGSQALRYGSSGVPTSLTAVTVDESGWTAASYQFTTTGSDYASVILTGNGSNTPDVMIDEIQYYEGVAADVPLWSTEVLTGNFRRSLAWPGSQVKSGFVYNNASSGGSGVLRLPGFPATPKVFTEITVIVAFKYDTASNNGPLITADYDPLLSSTISTFSILTATAGGLVFNPSPTNFSKVNLLGEGWQIAVIRLKANARSIHSHEIELASDTTAFAGFSARLFRLGSYTASVVSSASTYAMQGKHAVTAIFDKYLTDDQLLLSVQSVRERVSLMGETIAPMPAFLISMGDSQTASFAGARGPSWAVLQSDVGRFSPTLQMRNLAVGGYTLANIVAQLPTLTRIITQVKNMTGRKAVVAIYTGTNDQATLTANPASFWATVKSTLLDPIIAAGGIPVVGTLCPDGGTPPTGFEAARLTYNNLIRADTYRVMDFGGDVVMGDVATCAGANYDTDHRHFSTAGHLLLAPIAQAAIAAAIS